MKTKKYIFSIATLLGVVWFVFFYKINPCPLVDIRSDTPTMLCGLSNGQTLYQKTFSKLHNYFYPNELCSEDFGLFRIKCGDFSLFSPKCDQTATTTDCSKLGSLPQQKLTTSTQENEWETFENTKYGYSVRVPRGTFIEGIAMYDPDVHNGPELYFSTDGGYFDISAKILLEWLEKEELEKQKKLLALDLKSFANAIRNSEINDKNPYINRTDEEIGELAETQLNGTKAYSFTIKRPFFDFPINQTDSKTKTTALRYVFVENFRDQKMIIRQTTKEISDKMVSSIKFTNISQQ